MINAGDAFRAAVSIGDVDLYMPKRGDLVRHYKGNLYTVICVGRMSEARDQLHVVYWSHERKSVWIRPLGMFVELVDWPNGTHKPRFTLVSRDDGRDPCGVLTDAGGP